MSQMLVVVVVVDRVIYLVLVADRMILVVAVVAVVEFDDYCFVAVAIDYFAMAIFEIVAVFAIVVVVAELDDFVVAMDFVANDFGADWLHFGQPNSVIHVNSIVLLRMEELLVFSQPEMENVFVNI